MVPQGTLRLIKSAFYERTFGTRLTSQRPALKELVTTEGGFRMATSVGGTLPDRGGDFLIVDDVAKPEETRSAVQRQNGNDWFDHTLLGRLDDKRNGCIIIVMQRLHEDDLTGHVLMSGGWRHICLPAIAEREESYTIRQIDGSMKTIIRMPGEALHPERESIEDLEKIRAEIGIYNFAGQYQQTPAPAGGGIVQEIWFKPCKNSEKPKFDNIFQSWDTANNASELADNTVCTTWGVSGKCIYLLHVLRKKLEYPELKRLIPEHAKLFGASIVLIEDKSSGTPLIQDLSREGFHQITKCASPTVDKEIWLRNVSAMIENGFVFLPDEAHWLEDYKHELSVFPLGRYDDQVDSTSQALNWFRGRYKNCYGLIEYYKQMQEEQSVNPQYKAMFMRPRGPQRGGDRW